jgi:hypothetical protein
MHWTPVGNEVMAHALERHFEENAPGPWCR